MQNQQQAQMTMMKNKDMGMNMDSCHTTMYVFGILVLASLAAQVILQFKILKKLRKKQ
ncbi:MAG: hypothetical protein HY860_01665 [Chlamydiales bacterium]|nr:hypothetical protein [Chlamydiales bacterium]